MDYEREHTRRTLLRGGLAAFVGLVISPYALGKDKPKAKASSRGASKRGPRRVTVAKKSTPPPYDFRKDSEDVLLAKALYGEGRGQTIEERVEIAGTIVERLNDSKKRYGNNLQDVLLRGGYSCFGSSDPNRKKLENPAIYQDEKFQECLRIARDVRSGKVKPQLRATHYHPPTIYPYWAPKITKLGRVKVGNGESGDSEYSVHIFYRED